MILITLFNGRMLGYNADIICTNLLPKPCVDVNPLPDEKCIDSFCWGTRFVDGAKKSRSQRVKIVGLGSSFILTLFLKSSARLARHI